MVAPGAVGLTDGRRQLFAGQPVAVVAKVGDPGSHRVVGGEDAAVERGLGSAAGDGWGGGDRDVAVNAGSGQAAASH